MKLIISLLIPFVAGGVGQFFTGPAIPGWYAGLKKPFFSPPNFLFGPVWTILYLLMGISFYLIIKHGITSNQVKYAVIIFAVQMILNSTWSIIFFGLKNPLLALFNIGILWVAIIVMIIRFYMVERTAGLINIPYLLWVSFASVLNYFIYSLNRR